MGSGAVTRLHAHLSAQIARKIQAHDLVVWQDEAGEYRDIAAQVAPEGTRFEALAGSFYEFRRRVEDALGGDTPPRLLAYVDHAAPREDPLAEIRAAAGEFKLRLATLVRQALVGELTEARLAEIGRQARTFTEAEAALGSDGQHDVRVVALLGSADATRLALTVLQGARDDAIEADNAWAEVAATLRSAIGGHLEGAATDLRDAVFRHILLTAIDDATGGLPESLAPAWAAPGAEQRRSALEVLRQLQIDPALSVTCVEFAQRADQALDLSHALPWRPGLDRLFATETVEELVFAEAVRRLDAGDNDAAVEVARERLRSSLWVRSLDAGAARWGPRWRAVEAAGSFDNELRASTLPKVSNPADLLRWYVKYGYRVDQTQRRLELARTGLAHFGELEEVLSTARSRYLSWLDRLAQCFSAALEAHPLEAGAGLLRQGDIYDQFVTGARGPVAYVWVDALRYELGDDLADALRAGGARVQLHAAIAAAPTITQVGMANLLPHAGEGLLVDLDADDLVVSVGGHVVGGVPERRDLLRARHTRLIDLELNYAAQLGDKALGNAIKGADLVLVRSTEVDAAGETGLLAVGWSSFETTTALLASVVARLLHTGVSRVVITADHGFIALGDGLGPSFIIDPPSGAAGVLKRRVFAGHGGTTSDVTLRVPLSALGILGGLDLIVPRGLGVFRAGGARQFFHGGLSPEELVVPVIVVDAEEERSGEGPIVGLSVAGGRITTGAFSAMLEFSGNLFATTTAVRLLAMNTSGATVARVVSGDGFEPATGTVMLTAGGRTVLTLQVVANLAAGSRISLSVVDARTGRIVAKTDVEVVAPVVVDDDLG